MATKQPRGDLSVIQEEICDFKVKRSKSTQEQIEERFSKKSNLQIAWRTVVDVLKQKVD